MSLTKLTTEEKQQNPAFKTALTRRNDYKEAVKQQYQHSMRAWKMELYDLYTGSGFATHQEIPEVPAEEVLQKNTKLVTKKSIGSMEMGKAKREYKEKRTKAQDRKAAVDAYFEKINEEQTAIQNEEAHALRDEWDLMKLFDKADEQRKFMDDCTSGDNKVVIEAMDKAFAKLEAVDLSIFKYNKDDDLFENFEEKRRIMDAGHILRSMVEKYIQKGGTMVNERYVRLQALASFLEAQEIMCNNMMRVVLHPAYLTVRDKDLKKLSYEETMDRVDQLEKEIKALENAKQEGPELEQKVNLKNFLNALALEKLRQRDDKKLNVPKKGQDPVKNFNKQLDMRKKQNTKQWTKNLKDLADAVQRREERRKELFKDVDVHLDHGIWMKSGLKERQTTHASIIELVYLQRYQKSVKDLEDPKNMEDLKKVRDEVEAILHSQKPVPKGKEKPEIWPEPEEVKILSDLYTEMIRGFLRQFSVIGQKVMYRQFLGFSQMTTTSLTTLHSGWGETAEMNTMAGLHGIDIMQIASANPIVTQKAFSNLSKEELRALREITTYTGNVGGCLAAFIQNFRNAGFIDTKAVTEKKVGELLEGTSKHDDTAKLLKFTEWFLRSYSGGETKQKNVANEKGKWTKQDGIGTFAGCFMNGGSAGTDMEAIYAYVKSGEAKQHLDKEYNDGVTALEIVGSIKQNAEGVVEPPKGY